MSNEVLRVTNLTKSFGGIAVNDGINLSLHKSEILAILGANGAGKSTFCKMLTGIYSPDDGEISLNGVKTSFAGPADSIAAGINMVYQERNLVGALTGAQNICLAREPTKGRLISEKDIIRQAEETSSRLGIKVPLNVPTVNLGAGEQQLIEILRALQTNPKLLILDEPTASLGIGEIGPFLEFIKSIKRTTDIAIIFISHKIEEVFEIADTIAVFTDGKNVLYSPKADTTEDACISAMLRTDEVETLLDVTDIHFSGEPLLKVGTGEYDGKPHNLCFELYPGEIVGFYGLVGAGRTECAEALFGLRRSEIEYTFNNEIIKQPHPGEMIAKGMVLTPEKRANGLFRAMSLVDNICNMFLDDLLKNRILRTVDKLKSRTFTHNVLGDNYVKYDYISQPVSSLSGGNMQKVIIGRSIASLNVKLLILDEPTTGLDIGAKTQVYKKLRILAEQRGITVMMISSELEELLSNCNRIYVFADGNCITEFKHSCFDKQQILETAIRGRKL